MAEEAKAGEAAQGGDAPKKGKVARVVALAVVAGAVAWGIVHYRESRLWEETDDAFLEGRIVPVSSRVAGHVAALNVKDNAEVKEGEILVAIDRRDFELRLEKAKAALETARARHRAGGETARYAAASTGAGVGEADAGVERARAAVATARAGVITASARVEVALAQANAARMQLAQTESQIAAAESRAALAASDAKRYGALAEKGIVTAQQLEQSQTAAKTAAAEVEALKSLRGAATAQIEAAKAAERTAREGEAQAKAQVEEAAAAVEQALSRRKQADTGAYQVEASRSQAEALAADVAAAEAAVKQAELDLSYTAVPAPVAGRVTKKAVEPGQFVSPGQALFALVPRDLWVVANFKETQLNEIRPGQEVEIRIDAYPDHEFRGRVDSIQSGTGARFSLLPPENATGNYVKVVQRMPVKIVFTEPVPPDLAAGPGMSVVPKVRVR